MRGRKTGRGKVRGAGRDREDKSKGEKIMRKRVQKDRGREKEEEGRGVRKSGRVQ